MTPELAPTYHRHSFPAEIISHAVWLTADPAALAAHAVVEPAAQRAARLMPEPLPGQPDHGPTQARFACLRDAAGFLARAMAGGFAVTLAPTTPGVSRAAVTGPR